MVSHESAGGEPAVDYEQLLDTYGLGPQELDTEITFGKYTGSVAAMLSDEQCPVGGVVADAYRSGGIETVEARLQGFGLSMSVSDETLGYHRGETDRDSLLRQVAVEPPDFLV